MKPKTVRKLQKATWLARFAEISARLLGPDYMLRLTEVPRSRQTEPARLMNFLIGCLRNKNQSKNSKHIFKEIPLSQQSRTQSPQALWSAGRRLVRLPLTRRRPANQRACGLWVRDCYPRVSSGDQPLTKTPEELLVRGC